MKRILWLIACLMTMVMFSSCSKDEEDELTLDSNTIIGEWYDEENETIYFFVNGAVELRNTDGEYRYNYTLTDTQIIFVEKDMTDYDTEIRYYEGRIYQINEILKTARGAIAKQLEEELKECERILKACKYAKTHNIYYYYADIISKSLYDLVFKIDDKIYKLHRTSKHSNF